MRPRGEGCRCPSRSLTCRYGAAGGSCPWQRRLAGGRRGRARPPSRAVPDSAAQPGPARPGPGPGPAAACGRCGAARPSPSARRPRLPRREGRRSRPALGPRLLARLPGPSVSLPPPFASSSAQPSVLRHPRRPPPLQRAPCLIFAL